MSVFIALCSNNLRAIPTCSVCIGKAILLITVSSTGRQLPPLSSVLYRIISKRRYILAAQLLLRENQVPREVALIAISLACLLVQ
jgi:hypothetical protein